MLNLTYYQRKTNSNDSKTLFHTNDTYINLKFNKPKELGLDVANFKISYSMGVEVGTFFIFFWWGRAIDNTK